MLNKLAKFDIFFYLLGGALVALSVSCFAVPNGIAAGGFSGVATIVYALTGAPVGTTVLLMNIPVFLIGARKFGVKFIYKSIIATVIMTVLIDLTAAFVPPYRGDVLLSSVFGGVLSGIGLALVFMHEATTGGVDIIAKIINLKYSYISIGNMIMIIDAVIVIASAVAYRNVENAMYAVVMIFIQSKSIDWLVYGADKGRVLIINSKKYREIAEKIMFDMRRGVTVLDGTGAYTNTESKVILCAVRRYEAATLHKIVRSVDEHAFVVTVEAGEILGEGFKQI